MLDISHIHDYQHTAIDHIIKNPRSALFLDMGLGKTVSTLTAIHRMMYEELEVGSVLIIAPKRVAESVWDVEIEKWAHLKGMRVSKVLGTEKQRLQALKTKAEIYTLGRDNTAWICAQYGGTSLPFDWIIIDELSSYKNPKSLRFKALRKAIKSASRVTGLTGTPAPNGYLDLWSQMYLIDGGERLGDRVTKYREAYFIKKYSGWGYDIREGSEAEINNKIKDVVISMKKEDYLDMPSALTNDIILDLPAHLSDAYKEFEKEAVLEFIQWLEDNDQEITAMNSAGLRNKLLQFANGAIYDREKNVHHIHDLKLDALQEVVDEANGKPVLVAWCFQHDRDRILKKFKNAVQLKTDEHIKQWNRGEIPMLLMHPASGGHGLNLQKGGHIIAWFGLNDSLELYQQLNCRLDRQGQTESVIINRILINGTEDLSVASNLARKDKTQEGLMQAVKALVNKYKKHFKK